MHGSVAINITFLSYRDDFMNVLRGCRVFVSRMRLNLTLTIKRYILILGVNDITDGRHIPVTIACV